MPSTAQTGTRDLSDDPTYNALRRRRNLFGVVAALFLALVIISGLLDEMTSANADRSFVVGAAPRLVIRDGVSGGLRGGITVDAGAGDRIVVQGKVHGTWRVRYTLAQRGDDVVIDVQPRPLLGWLGFLGPARFAVTAPPPTRLEIDTRDAAMQVHGITGGGGLHTDNGSIDLNNAGGLFKVATTNGAITVTRFDGSAELRSTNGRVDVEESRGTFDVRTTNGVIVLDAELRSPGRHQVVSTNGAVTVRLAGQPSLRIDARSTNGAVVAHRPIAAADSTGHALTGAIGAGEAELRVLTTNGRIAIE